MNTSALQARIDAIEEIISEKTYHIEKLRGLLINIPDLVKGLTRIQYGKVRPPAQHVHRSRLIQLGPTHRTRHHPHQPAKNRRRIQEYHRRTI
jgi:DNA mismatch repair ATPase MutS